MKLFDFIFGKKSRNVPEKETSGKNQSLQNANPTVTPDISGQDKISAARFRGRWYGLMLILGQQSGKDMPARIKDKGSEVLTMLEISNEFPEEFKFVNKIIAFETEREKADCNISQEKREADYLLGIVEAKKVYLEDKNWDRLLEDKKV